MNEDLNEFQICWNIMLAIGFLVVILDLTYWRP